MELRFELARVDSNHHRRFQEPFSRVFASRTQRDKRARNGRRVGPSGSGVSASLPVVPMRFCTVAAQFRMTTAWTPPSLRL